MDTIFLRLFLYVIAYLTLEVGWSEFLATTALSESKAHDSDMSVLIPRISGFSTRCSPLRFRTPDGHQDGFW